MDMPQAFQALGIALLLGLLVGLQRERGGAIRIAGIRTFPLITMLGTLCALLQRDANAPWLVPAGLLAIAATSIAGNHLLAHRDDTTPEAGITTEVAAMVMYIVGAWVVLGDRAVASGAGVGVALLLHAKTALHSLAARLGDADVRAIMQFALITFIVLPLVPNRVLGPYQVLNPYHAWLMVVLVVGISLMAYLASKFLAPGRGVVVAGLLGGLISSTATTVSFARGARANGALAWGAVLAITLATCTLLARIIAEVAVVAPAVAWAIARPVAILLGIACALGALLVIRARRADAPTASPANPSELRTALVFAALYVGVLFVAAAAKDRLGDSGLLLVGALAGLTDLDAITLSTARLASESRITPESASRVVLVAFASNCLFKLGIAGVLGGSALLARATPILATLAAIAAALALL